MKVRGGPWRSPWRLMELRRGLHGAPWRSPWSSVEVRGGPWRSMEVRGGLHGDRWSLHGPPWRPPRTFTDPHGPPWRPPWSLHGGLNYVNKKYIFSYCSSLNKEYLVHQYSFNLKWFNCLYSLFFKGFHGFYLIFAHSNLDILFKICLRRCYFILVPTWDFPCAQQAHLFQKFCTRNTPKPNCKDCLQNLALDKYDMSRNVLNTFCGFWGAHRRDLRHIRFLYRRSKCQPNDNVFQSPRRSTNLRHLCYCEESELLICRLHQFGEVCMAIIFQLAFLMMRNL